MDVTTWEQKKKERTIFLVSPFMICLYTGLQVQVQADDVCGHKCTAMNRIRPPAHRQKYDY